MKSSTKYTTMIVLISILCIAGIILLVLSLIDYNKDWTLPASIGIITLGNFLNLYNIRKQTKKNRN